MFLLVAQLVEASCPPYDFITPQEARVVFDGQIADAALATTARDNLFAALPAGCRNTVATSSQPNLACPANHYYASSLACTIAADGLDASGTVSMSEEIETYDQYYCSTYDTTVASA